MRAKPIFRDAENDSAAGSSRDEGLSSLFTKEVDRVRELSNPRSPQDFIRKAPSWRFPIRAILMDGSGRVVFANEACARVSPDFVAIVGHLRLIVSRIHKRRGQPLKKSLPRENWNSGKGTCASTGATVGEGAP